MSNCENVWSDVGLILDQFRALKDKAYKLYSNMVDAVINGKITTQREIEAIMDGLTEFSFDERFRTLFKRLCEKVYSDYPKMVGEYINLFKMTFAEK